VNRAAVGALVGLIVVGGCMALAVLADRLALWLSARTGWPLEVCGYLVFMSYVIGGFAGAFTALEVLKPKSGGGR
jgi:hypothetical protein